MDDLSLMSPTVSGAQTLLSWCTTALIWAGLEFRADKSRSICIIKCRSMNTTPFSVPKAKDQLEPSSPIPTIHSRPVKFLGRIIDGSLSDRNSSAELANKHLAGLKTIDRSHFTGTQNLWIIQHLLIPRIQWPLLIYDVPISLAFKLEQKVSVFIRKRLHLHHSTSCESEIKFNKICGSQYNSRLRLGYTTTFKVPKNKSSKDYRRYISNHYRTIDDTYSMSKAVQLQVQGQWTRWLNYIKQDFSWATLMAMPPNLTSFCLASTFDILPSPSNLKRWRITAEAKCTLCSKDVCTTAHILGACKVSLQQGRYTFRHDTVLHKIIESLKSFILNIKQTVPISPKSSIKFV